MLQFLMALYFFQLNTLFSDTKQELEETSEELSVTSKNLENKTVMLHLTSTALQATTQDCNEQKFLVEEHVKSEAVLYSQADQVTSICQ